MSKVWNKLSSRILVYGGDWASAQYTVRASTFAKMVELAKDKVQYYISDLYHDAIWLKEEFLEPGEFQWVARESGTWIGESALLIRDDSYTNQSRYKFVIREDDNQKWVLETYEEVEEVVQANVPDTTESWVNRHAALHISECEMATAIEGCIFHPAPVNGWTECTGYFNESGSLQHDGDTCPSHEDDLGAKYRDVQQAPFAPDIKETTDEQRDDIIKMLFEPNIPTLRNDLTSAPSVPIRKEMKMEEIIRDLREKYSEADSTKDQLEEFVSNINDAVEELETYLSDLDDLISNLDSLPEVSIYVDLDTVSFDS